MAGTDVGTEGFTAPPLPVAGTEGFTAPPLPGTDGFTAPLAVASTAPFGIGSNHPEAALAFVRLARNSFAFCTALEAASFALGCTGLKSSRFTLLIALASGGVVALSPNSRESAVYEREIGEGVASLRDTNHMVSSHAHTTVAYINLMHAHRTVACVK